MRDAELQADADRVDSQVVLGLKLRLPAGLAGWRGIDVRSLALNGRAEGEPAGCGIERPDVDRCRWSRNGEHGLVCPEPIIGKVHTAKAKRIRHDITSYRTCLDAPTVVTASAIGSVCCESVRTATAQT